MTRRSDRALARALLVWYDRHRRVLPWRALPGASADPYRVWLSEVMLQQTTVATVGPYFERFLARWPTVEALAAASLDEVLTAWAGLGYYARARNLHACARRLVADHGGHFPRSESALQALPGIGRYTAAAIAAIAFGERAAPVDGNVERVLARLDAVDTPLPQAKAALTRRADALVPAERAGDHAQALMDLGATICTPRRPRCLLCPWSDDCQAHARGEEEAFPRRGAKKDKPLRCGIAFWLERTDGAVLFRRRPEEGLLGGLWEIPSTPWADRAPPRAQAERAAPARGPWQALQGCVRHSFTHFDLELEVWRASAKRSIRVEGQFVEPAGWSTLALPTLMKKVVAHATRAQPANG